MEMLLYQSTQFRDVKKILDRAHGFAGLLTAGGIEELLIREGYMD